MFNTTGTDLLVDLGFTGGIQTAWFGVNATVPLEEASGNKQQLVTVLATDST